MLVSVVRKSPPSIFNIELVCIFPKGKSLPYFLKMRALQINCKNILVISFMIKNFTERINHHAVTRMINFVAIFTHPVNANNVALVFDRPCLQQSFPRNISFLGPVGNIDKNVVFKTVSELTMPTILPTPHREP